MWWISFLLAYLIGAIPFSILIGKIFYGKDIRKEGSGNAGATNTFRVLGKTAGSIVLLLDILKGVAAVELFHLSIPDGLTTESKIFYQLALGITAVIGHIFPIYLRFKGGKGVATGFGVAVAVFPISALIAFITFTIIFLAFNYVSLGSLTASVAFATTVFIQNIKQPLIGIAAILISAIIFYTHRENIKRLIKGNESKMFLKKRNE
jgi:acyl phosphate:glycerol-3-phosphate acyltransferase